MSSRDRNDERVSAFIERRYKTIGGNGRAKFEGLDDEEDQEPYDPFDDHDPGDAHPEDKR